MPSLGVPPNWQLQPCAQLHASTLWALTRNAVRVRGSVAGVVMLRLLVAGGTTRPAVRVPHAEGVAPSSARPGADASFAFAGTLPASAVGRRRAVPRGAVRQPAAAASRAASARA